MYRLHEFQSDRVELGSYGTMDGEIFKVKGRLRIRNTTTERKYIEYDSKVMYTGMCLVDECDVVVPWYFAWMAYKVVTGIVHTDRPVTWRDNGYIMDVGGGGRNILEVKF